MRDHSIVAEGTDPIRRVSLCAPASPSEFGEERVAMWCDDVARKGIANNQAIPAFTYVQRDEQTPARIHAILIALAGCVFRGSFFEPTGHSLQATTEERGR